MFGSTDLKPRNMVAGVVVSALAGVLAFTPPALAASRHGVRWHLGRAQSALSSLTAGSSVQGNAQFTHHLNMTSSQFGTAESMSVNLAVQANTPDLRQAAADALASVANAEGKAETKLGSLESRVDGAFGAAVAKADLEVTQGHALALSILGDVSAQGGGDSQQVEATIAAISAQAGTLLGDVVSKLSAAASSCQANLPAASSSEASNVQAQLDGIPVRSAAHLVDAGGTLLGQVTSSEIASVNAQVTSGGACASSGDSTAPAGASASAQGSVITNLGL